MALKSEIFGLSLIIVEIIFGCLQNYFVVKSIVVERNQHAYFKLPTNIWSQLRLTGQRNFHPNKEFYILQCPRNETLIIPKPKDMYSCAIVGKYNDAALNEIESNKEKPVRYVGSDKVKIRSMLHTKVDFKPKKLYFKGKCNYLGVEKSYKPIAGKEPIKEEVSDEDEYNDDDDDDSEEEIYHGKQPKILTDHDQFFADTKNKVLYTKNSDPQRTSKAKVYEKEEPNDDSTESIANVRIKSPETPLKYLGVKDAIKKLFKEKQQKYEPNRDNETSSSEAKQFFAENIKYRKGEKKVGLQTMYHRDEIFKDHIFYDDLDESGHYDNSAKAHTKVEK